MKKIYLFSAAALMLASCAKDIVETPSTTPSDDTENGYVTLTFTATHPERAEVISPEDSEAVTKTTLNEADGTVKWSEGDQLKLIIEGDEPVTTEAAVISDEGKTATFKATIKEGKTIKYAVYPSSIEATLSEDGLNVTVKKKQDGTFKNASIEVGKVGDGNSISLENVCSLLKFTVANKDAKKVFIGGNGAPFAGTAKVNSGILGADYTDAADVPGYSPNVEIDVKGAGTYYAAVLPAKTTGLSMQIYNDSNEVVAENISSNVLDAKRKTIKDLGTLRNTPFNEIRFVSKNGSESSDGKTWETAWSPAKLLATLGSIQLYNHVLIVEGVDCRLSNNKDIITIQSMSKFKMYGGFPGGLKGREITSRDLNKYKTNILGRKEGTTDNDNKRHFQINGSGNEVTFDGICFKESYQNVTGTTNGTNNKDLYAGTSLLIGNATGVYCVNCIFDSNEKIGDGIIRIGTNDSKGVATAKFERCTFSNNSVSRYGLIKVYPGGTVKLKDCDFTNTNEIGDKTICSAESNCVIDEGGNNYTGYKLSGLPTTTE